MATIIAREALPHTATAHRFEGEQYGDVGVSFFLLDAPPGGGPGLHTHPYAEVFVVQEGGVFQGQSIMDQQAQAPKPAQPAAPAASAPAASSSGHGAPQAEKAKV